MDIKEFLSRLQNIKKQGNGFTGKCPGHDDRQNSLSIAEAADKRILLHCHAGCSIEDIISPLGLKKSDLYADKEVEQGRKILEVYPYKNLEGEIIHETVRYEPKSFTQRVPDGKGGYIYSLKDIKTIIYNLPEVSKAISLGEMVYIVEGEKDCNNLAKLGMTATTSPMGAGKWQEHHSDFLKNAVVIIVPDNDEPGRKHAEQVAESLYGKAKSIKIINLVNEIPELPQKGDITDFLKKLGKRQGLMSLNKLVKEAEEWNPNNEKTSNQEVLHTKDNDLESPIPLDNFNPPSFPTHCLPDWVADYVEAVAEDTQTPEDMAAVAALGILSIPCSKVYKVEAKPGWQELTNLYCTIVAKPGERKSSIMSHITKPIYEYEAEMNEYLKADIARNQAERKILEGEAEKLKGIATKDNNAENRARALDKAEELSNFKDLRQVRLTCDDVSPEKLAGLLADYNGRMAIVSAEGGIFDIMSGRYSQNINIDVFLKGHSGDPLRVDRVGRNCEYVQQPALSLVIAIQPDVLAGIMQNSSFRGRGLTARFLYSIPLSKVGSRNVECMPIPEYVKNAYYRNIRQMLDIKIPEKPYILKLSYEANKLSTEFAKELEPKLIGDLEHIADWASKLHGAILRIAGILHVAEKVGQRAWEYEISAGTFQAALIIGKYFIEHAKVAFALMGTDRNIYGCKYILKWLKQQNKEEHTKREIHRGNRKYFQRAEDIEPALKLLCEYGYLKEIEHQRAGAVKRSDKSYLVNSLFLSSSPKDIPDTLDTRKEINAVCPENSVCPQEVGYIPSVLDDDILTGDAAIDFLKNGGELVI